MPKKVGNKCPSDSTLEHLHNGQLAVSDWSTDRIKKHISGCAPCTAHLMRLEHDDADLKDSTDDDSLENTWLSLYGKVERSPNA